MAVDDIYQVSAVFTQSGREWVMGFYYRISVDDATKTPVVIAAALGADWRTTNYINEIDQMLSDEVDHIACFTQMIHPTIQFAIEEQFAPTAGQVVAAPLPAHSCQLIHQTGEAPGRSFQGRAYVSGIPQTFEDDGRLNALAASEFAAHGLTPFGAHILAPIVASPLRMVHTNYSKKRAAAADPPVFSDLQTCNLLPSIATQRGRVVAAVSFAP